jgi:C4-dicarboxylate-binding protein DctP
MPKKYLFLFMAVIALFAVQPAGAQTVIKLANAGPDEPDNRTVKAVAIFEHIVETKTQGAVEVQAYHASKLGDEREALEGIRMGTIQMGTLTSGPVPGFFKPVMLFDIPYLFSSAPAAWEFFHGPVAAEFKKEFLEKTGVRILDITENGYRHFTNNVRPIHTPADMDGLKVRTMQNPAHMAMTEALGADPTPIPFSELYMALQQGVVDAMECPVVLIHDMKFYEVQDYMVRDGHLYNPIFVFINNRFFENLSPEHQKIVREAAQVLAASHNGFSQEANRDGLAKLKNQGMEIYTPTAEELQKFRDLAQPAGLKFISAEIGSEWVDKALKGAQKAEEKVDDRAEEIVQEHIDMANEKYAAIKK